MCHFQNQNKPLNVAIFPKYANQFSQIHVRSALRMSHLGSGISVHIGALSVIGQIKKNFRVCA